jgi:hypothetical protein
MIGAAAYYAYQSGLQSDLLLNASATSSLEKEGA